MKYTPSALVSEFSGAQGSTVASHNRFGPYFRNRVIPVNPNTLVQQNARNNLAAISQAWKTLTDAERAAWAAYGATITLYDSLGRPYSPNGHLAFVGVNRNTFIYSGLGTITVTPPSAAAPDALASATLTAAGGIPALSLAYTVSPLAALTKLVIEAAGPKSTGVSFVGRSEYREIFVTAAAAATPANILAAYTAKFGAIITGRKYFVRGRVLNSEGAASAWLVATATAT